MSIITVPIAVRDPADLGKAIGAANHAAGSGGDLIEWRLDLVVDAGPSLLATVVRDTDVGSILTLRSVEEGGGFGGTDEDLAEWIDQIAALDTPPIWVDVEYARWSRSEAVRSAAASLGQAKLLLSFHDFTGRPADLLRITRDMQEAECDAVKLVWRARSVRDAVECRDLLADRSKPMIALCMGPHGVMSRIMAGAWGGLMTFAAADDSSATAPGQPILEQLQSWYRFRCLDADT
ncbi:MAG: type I 3-dehydroquinate dehydratase, partial [Phycisphaerales bacterium]|nr:type I 3-dehydroquinate dehydratase [Phycisphaerales bacterium]